MSRFLNVVLTESPFDSPFAPKQKCGGEWISSAVGATAQTIGDIIGFINNNNSNQVLREMNRENIEFQKETNRQNREENRYLLGLEQSFADKQLKAQQQYNIEQWNRENSYNNPINQVARLKAAGINPVSLVGNGNATSPVSSVSGAVPSSHPSNAVAPQNTFAPNQPFQPHPELAINAFNESMLANANVREITSRAHHTDLQSDLLDESMSSQVKYWKQLVHKGGIEGALAQKQLDFVGATMDYDIKMRYGQLMEQDQALKNLQEQYRGMQLNNDILNIQKAYADSFHQGQVAQVWRAVAQADAQIGLINANKLLTDEQRLHEIEKRVGQTLDNGLKGINFEVQKEVKSCVIQSYKNNANIGMADAFDKWRYNSHGNQRSVGDSFGMDFLEDIMKRKFFRVGYVPKF